MQLPLYFRLPKVADGIDVKGPIPAEICGDCMKGRQQKEPYYEPVSQPKDKLEYLQYGLRGPLCYDSKRSKFYLGIRDGWCNKY